MTGSLPSVQGNPADSERGVRRGDVDVLAVYQRRYDSMRPEGWLDEQPTQLVGETGQPQPARPGLTNRNAWTTNTSV